MTFRLTSTFLSGASSSTPSPPRPPPQQRLGRVRSLTPPPTGTLSPPSPPSDEREGLEFEFEDGLNDIVLAIVWGGQKVGAAYYLADRFELHVLPDVREASPDFELVRSLFRQLAPRFLVIGASQDIEFLNLCKSLCGIDPDAEGDKENAGDLLQQLRDAESKPQLIKVQSKVFNPDDCRSRLLSVKLPYEPDSLSDEERERFISSFIPMNNEKMVRAAGGLLSFLDKRGMELLLIDTNDGFTPVMDLKTCSMDDFVIVDESALQSLQIFSVDHHPSTFKQMKQTGNKEGISVFSLLSQNCSTLPGIQALKLMLLRPSRDLNVLNRRHNIVGFFCNPGTQEFSKAIKDCLKTVKSLKKSMYRLKLLHLSVTEWKSLYDTLWSCVLIGDLCATQADSSLELFQEIGEPRRLDIIRGLTREIIRVIDFDESTAKNRFVAKYGVNADLDQSKRFFLEKDQVNCLKAIMSATATEELEVLPAYMTRCSVIYIPEIGYLLSIHFWNDDLSETILRNIGEGYDFQFASTDEKVAYYRSPRTKELDVIVGDCQAGIIQLETGIMIKLTEHIQRQTRHILKIGSLVAELDCLMSMSILARSGNYVRPEISGGGRRIKIKNGRHPLVETVCQDFVDNDTEFDREERIALLTGPNASGKSVYLKQVAVISLMALSGSFVPASYARIPTFDRIYTRIHASESIATQLSTFMMDLIQVSLMLRMSTPKSLVIIDEFGKGTADTDGLALLGASLNHFIRRGQESPTIFVATHFQALDVYLEDTYIVKFMNMRIIEANERAVPNLEAQDDPNKSVVYLFKTNEGLSSTNSFAHHVASHSGINKILLIRSKEVLDYIESKDQSDLAFAAMPLQMRKAEQDKLLNLAAAFMENSVDDDYLMEQVQEIVTNTRASTRGDENENANEDITDRD